MNKALFSLLVLLLTLPVFALANDFPLHNGLRFGMTKEEAYSIEKKAGVDLDEDGKWRGIIAGQKDAELTLSFFGDYNTLNEVWYTFNDLNSYNTLNNGLISKYGASEYNNETGGYLEEPTTNKSEQFPCYLDLTSNAQYSQWLISYTDTQAILITHVCYTQSTIITDYDMANALIANNPKLAKLIRNTTRDEHYIRYHLLDEYHTSLYQEKSSTYSNEFVIIGMIVKRSSVSA